MADTLASLRARITELEEQLATAPAQVWVGGAGTYEVKTLARNLPEALNNMIEAIPILGAIGCHAEPMPAIDGYPVVCNVPADYVYGDDRRNAEVLG